MSRDRGTQTKKGKVEVAQVVDPEDENPNREAELVRVTATLELTSDTPVFSCLFEVFGIVQGVSFRMYTLRRAQKLGVRGWCQNTKTNTVKGEIEALFNAFEEMRLWLKYTGSPTSRIDKVIFSDTVERQQFTFENFSILMEQ